MVTLNLIVDECHHLPASSFEQVARRSKAKYVLGLSASMEVDLLFAEGKIAIEVDGPHHFTGPEAYRRDRRKNLMLQEHGYCVIRFLAEDVGKYLDHVLDTVLRVLTTYNRRNETHSTAWMSRKRGPEK